MAGWEEDGLPSGTGKWTSKWMVGQGALGWGAVGFPLGLSEARKVLWRNVGGAGSVQGNRKWGRSWGPCQQYSKGEKSVGGNQSPDSDRTEGKVGIRWAMGREVEPNGV